jgi:hypothetical protein
MLHHYCPFSKTLSLSFLSSKIEPLKWYDREIDRVLAMESCGSKIEGEGRIAPVLLIIGQRLPLEFHTKVFVDTRFSIRLTYLNKKKMDNLVPCGESR